SFLAVERKGRPFNFGSQPERKAPTKKRKSLFSIEAPPLPSSFSQISLLLLYFFFFFSFFPHSPPSSLLEIPTSLSLCVFSVLRSLVPFPSNNRISSS